MSELNIAEKDFLEVAIDDKGYIGLVKHSDSGVKRGYTYRPVLRISNATREHLAEINAICDGEGHLYKRQQGFLLWFRASAILPILLELNLDVKEKQRVLLLEAMMFLRENRSHKANPNLVDNNYALLDEIYVEMRRLNKRGVG